MKSEKYSIDHILNFSCSLRRNTFTNSENYKTCSSLSVTSHWQLNYCSITYIRSEESSLRSSLYKSTTGLKLWRVVEEILPTVSNSVSAAVLAARCTLPEGLKEDSDFCEWDFQDLERIQHLLAGGRLSGRVVTFLQKLFKASVDWATCATVAMMRFPKGTMRTWLI